MQKTRNNSEARICIVGSIYYENRVKIKDLIFKLKNTFNENLTIAGAGKKYGTDTYVKKYSIELEVNYVEFNTSDTPYTIYSYMPPNFYGKPYQPMNRFIRNKLMANYGDYFIIFKRTTGKTEPEVLDLIKRVQKLQKKIVIYEE